VNLSDHDSQTARRVLLTGANGDVGRTLIGSLESRYEVRQAVWDLSRPDAGAGDPAGAGGPTGPDVHRLNIEDLDAVVAVSAGMAAIVHLAGQREVDASWAALRGPNVEGVHNIFEAARINGVSKVVFASTNHVTGHYDEEKAWPISVDVPMRPDSLYGVTKAFGEIIGRYASDYYGLKVVCLRIGWVLPQPHNEMGLRMWLSPGDLGRLVVGALESECHYGVYYGVSANQRRHWDIADAKRDLGYEPIDDSEVFAAGLGL
jgi:NAD+ dependent glucose-6-phosphate dehydrogenase